MALHIKWNRHALSQFEALINHIEKDSPANAVKISRALLLKIDALLSHPEQCAPDKYKTHNDGSFRAFELHRCRVSYRYTGKEIRIVRVRHTKMTPKNY